MQVTGRFQPHPRGFGFVEPETPVKLTGDDGNTVVEIDSLFVPPDVARGWLADDVVVATAELDDRGRGNAVALTLDRRLRRFLVGTVATFAGGLVLRLDPRLGSGHAALSDTLSAQVERAEGRQIVATVTNDPEGRPIAGSLVAGPEPATSPTALRARAVVIAHGGAAPDSIPGGPAAIGLPVAETLGYALRATGRLASGGSGLAAGLSADVGVVPGVERPLQDWRELVAITVDDDTARDLDDALTATWSGTASDPVRLVVHIADAAGTVGIDSPADHYAATMGTTAYFVAGEKAPMLDPVLSEGELSLLPNEPRRVLSVSLDVRPDGTTSPAELETAWIEPTARLSYAAVDGYLDTGDPTHLAAGTHGPFGAALPVLRSVTEAVDALAEASRRLGVERDGRDTLESLFTAPTLEAAVLDGKIRAVEADPHPAAQRLVERMMVAANEAVAAWAAERDVPLLYRSHIGFDADRLPQLRAAAASIGVDLGPDDGPIVPVDVLRAIDDLEAADRHVDAATLATVAAGVVARASYSADPGGHGGLGARLYTHFTSPIRRYADLLVHRQIRAALAEEPLPYDRDRLKRLAAWLDARAGATAYAQTLERNALWSVLLERRVVPWPTQAAVTGLSSAGLKVRLLVPGIGAFITAAKALGAGRGERAQLELDEHGVATLDGRFRIGMRLPVKLDRVDDLGRAEVVPAG